jgi:hypothetical protein
MPRRHRRRWLGAAVSIGVLIGALGPGATGVVAKPPAECVTPGGVNINVGFGVSDWVVWSPFCSEIGAGHRWTVSNPWSMSPTFDVVPPGFVPAGPTPVDDFLAKFEAVKYVVDPGTKKEQTYVFTNGEDMGFLTLGPRIFANPVTLGSMSPLAPGVHVVDSYLVMNAQHCDGLGDDATPGQNCLEGEVFYTSYEFTVTNDKG